MDGLLQDIRYGVRMLRKNLGLSALIVAIVAIGVGASATIFSVVEKALLWDENPNTDRWVIVRPHFPRQGDSGRRFSSAEYFELRQLTDVFERIGAISGFNGTVFLKNLPEFIQGTYVTSDMIPMTSIEPLMGRAFSAADDQPGAPKTAVLTYEFWQNRMQGDRGILGKDLRIDDQHYTIIGVMPPHYELWGGELYLPFQLSPANSGRASRGMWVSAITKRGISEQQVSARLEVFARWWQKQYPNIAEYEGLKLDTWNIKQAVVAGTRPALLVLMGAVGLVLLISCSNIANLLLARASGRRREMAVRSALGAPRLRIVRQLLTESVMLAAAGGGLGVLLAIWGVPLIVALTPNDLPYSELIRLDSGALLVSLGIAAVMGILFGLAPAMYSSAGDLARAIREGGLQSGAHRGGTWARGALVVSQIALAMVVLAGAGLMVRTYRELLKADVGYNPHNALMAQLVLPAERYPTGDSVLNFHRQLLERLHAVPGVEGAAVATGRPMLDRPVDQATMDFYLAGHEGEKNVPNANFRIVTPDYFNVAGVRLLKGRLLNENDNPQTEPVAVINQTMAKLYWPKQDPIGQTVRTGNVYGFGLRPNARASDWVKIVGVVADARQVRVIELPVRQEIFFPMAQRAEMGAAVMLIVRSRMNMATLTDTVRHAVAAVDPDRPIFNVTTLEQAVADSFGPKRLAAVLLGFFAVVAVTLASVGLYGIMAYSVTQRTREIGIRMALGARRHDVLRMVVWEGSRLALVGLIVGISGAMAAAQVMRSLVYEISPRDPATLAGAAILLAAVAMASCYVPAQRVTRVDPMVALRYE